MNREYFDICEQDGWEQELANDPGYQEWLRMIEKQQREEQDESERPENPA